MEQDPAREKFLASLSDETLGFFFAHEYDANVSELLLDALTVSEYKLYQQWKLSKTRTSKPDPRSTITGSQLESMLAASRKHQSDLSIRLRQLEQSESDLKSRKNEIQEKQKELEESLKRKSKRLEDVKEMKIEIQRILAETNAKCRELEKQISVLKRKNTNERPVVPQRGSNHSARIQSTNESNTRAEKEVEDWEITAEYLKEMKDRTLKSLPSETNIVILGESGVGKSTFVNAFASYLQYSWGKTELEFECPLTQVNYVFQSEKGFNLNISLGPYGEYNEHIDISTIDPTVHELWIDRSDDTKKYIRLLDTPSIGEKNTDSLTVQKILSKLKEFKQINAVCILLPSNKVNMSSKFWHYVHEMLTHFDNDLMNHIFFCFTKSRPTKYNFENDLPAVQKLLTGSNLGISINRFNAFAFDNECVEYILCKRLGGGKAYRDSEAVNLLSWNKSSVSAFRLLEKISSRRPQENEQNFKKNNLRKYLEMISMPLLEILKLKLMNKQLLEQKIKILQTARSSSHRESNRLFQISVNTDSLSQVSRDILSTPIYNLKVRSLDKPAMICSSPRCKGCGPCMENCFVREPSNKVGHPELKYAFKFGKEVCKKCGCPWDVHQYTLEVYETHQDKTTGPTIDQQMLSLLREKRKLELEIDNILSCCIQFSLFNAANTVPGEVDFFQQAFDKVIREMENKRLDELTQMNLLYKQTVSQSKQNKVDAEKVKMSIEELKTITHWHPVVVVVETNYIRYREQIRIEIHSPRLRITVFERILCFVETSIKEKEILIRVREPIREGNIFRPTIFDSSHRWNLREERLLRY